MKEIVVQWDAGAYDDFSLLLQAVLEGKTAKRPPGYSQLLSSINKTIRRLKANPFCGDLIPRKYLPKKSLIVTVPIRSSASNWSVTGGYSTQ